MSQAAIMMQADQKLFDLVRKSENEKNLTREISSLNENEVNSNSNEDGNMMMKRKSKKFKNSISKIFPEEHN